MSITNLWHSFSKNCQIFVLDFWTSLFRKDIGFLLYIGNFQNEIVFFCIFWRIYWIFWLLFSTFSSRKGHFLQIMAGKNQPSIQLGFLLYFPLQRDIFFRLWHAKINQAFCWFFFKPFNLVKRNPLFSLQSANTRSMVSFLCG